MAHANDLPHDNPAEALLNRAREMRAQANSVLSATGQPDSRPDTSGGATPGGRPSRFVCRSSETMAAEAMAVERLASLGISPEDIGGGTDRHAERLPGYRSAPHLQTNARAVAHARSAEASARAARVAAAGGAGPFREWPEANVAGGGSAAAAAAAEERVRAAFPTSDVQQRMFHLLAGVSAEPESREACRRRVADTFGRGVPLKSERPDGCAICLEKLEKGEVALTLCCGHQFHESCIHEWLGRKEFCPLCKQAVV